MKNKTINKLIILASFSLLASSALAGCDINIPIDPTIVDPETTLVSSVSVSPNSKSLTVGETFTFTASVLPENATNQEVTWSVNNTGVLSISQDGTVTADEAGTATVKATAKDGSKKYGSATVTVTASTTPTKVSSVTVTPSTLSLKVGESFSLSVSVLPSNADVKAVTFSSTKTSVATVTSAGIVEAKGEGTATIKATANDGSGKYGSCTVTVSKDSSSTGDKNKYTILIYMCGSTLEYDQDKEQMVGMATDDLFEILAQSCPSDVNIVIETGGSQQWKSNSKFTINKDKLQRHHVEGNSLVTDASLTKANMGARSTLQSFVEYGLTNYPAEQTGLILWNHGGGLAGVCNDEYSGDNLSAAEVYTAVKNARSAAKMTEKLTWIGYDACLMNVADIASVNAENFEYMVAAQESESGSGWDYDKWLPELYKNTSISPEVLLPKICDTFISDNNTYNGQDYSYWNNNTLSVLDLSKVENFKTQLEDIVSKVGVNSKSTFKSKVAAAYKKSLRFGGDFDEDNNYESTCDHLYGLADALSLVKQLKASYSSIDLTAFETALNELVIHNAYGYWYTWTEQPTCGLNLFVAYANLISDGHYQYGLQVNEQYYTTNDSKLGTWRTMNYYYGFIEE